MILYSTNNTDHTTNLKRAVMQSLAPDKGLYMPIVIDPLPKRFFEDYVDMSFQELSFAVARHIIGDEIPEDTLQKIINEAITFDAPVVPLSDYIGVLELWHGPSLAFKDFGARFMAGLMSYFNDSDQKLTILVATSGDTGGAVAYGFLDVPGIEVVILYPSGKVSHLQEQQLTTLGSNITAVEVAGTFDDCQSFVKQAFLDQELQGRYRMSSANSINIARLIPQSFYYFEAMKQVTDSYKRSKVVFSVPSGNFGNLTAGLLAKKMGLPIDHFCAATNANNIVPQYLTTGRYTPQPSIATISNAMDVGNPSNFVRMQAIYHEGWSQMKGEMTGFWYDDDTTRQEIRLIKDRYEYVSEPHGAIAHKALKEYLSRQDNSKGIFLATAHPAKFLDIVEGEIGEIAIPDRLSILKDKKKVAVPMNNDFDKFKTWMLSRD